MKIKISGGTLEAELEGNPLEMIKSQLAQAIQKQDEDIQVMGSHVNDSIVQVHQMLQQLSSSTSQEISNLQHELSLSVSQLLANDQNNPAIIELNNKLQKLSSALKARDSKIKALTVKANKPVVKKVVKVIKQDNGIEELHSTIGKVTRKVVPAEKYLGSLPKVKTEAEVRQSIAKAGVSPHSSKSNMHDKLNAQPRMPI